MQTKFLIAAMLLTGLSWAFPSSVFAQKGWVSLFDGKTTNGWHTYGKTTVGQAWKVEDKLILEVNVVPASKKPILAEFEKENWKAFLRENDQNILAPAVMLDVWKMADSPLPENFTYTEREQILLNELQQGPQTLSWLCKKTKTKRFTLQKIISKLIRWEIVQWKVQGGIAFYSIKK